jgi:hypothetical protein
MEITMTELQQLPTQRCKHLHCKSMMVYGEDFMSDPDFQAGLTDFWCMKTSKSIGPDDDHVDLEDCSLTTRPCYQEY